MIPSGGIAAYLASPRDDHRWLKDVSHAELDRLLARLDPAPKYWEGLGFHQKVALYLGITYGSMAFWYDMGTGKTLASLELLQYWWDTQQLRRALIFVISDKAFPTWERQIAQYKISVPYVSLDAGASERKWELLERFGDGIVLVTYPGAVAMASSRVKIKGKGRFQLNPKLVKRLLHRVDGLVLDESTRCGSTRSLTYELCRRASQASLYRYALAGMPFGRDPTPLWAQMNLVDHGASLGETLGLFRTAFFTESDNYWGGPYSKTYTFKPRLQGKLSRMVQHRSITYTADECIDLPPIRRVVEEFSLPEDTRAYYKKVLEELVEAKGSLRAIENVFLRMRQLSSGYLGVKDDETGERAEIEFDQNPKLGLLTDLVLSLPEGRKALVFYQYTYSGRRIVKALTDAFERGLGADKPVAAKERDKVVWLWSGTKNPRQALAQFMDDPKTRVAVINNQVGAYSLDGLQVANYEFHYETAVSVIDRTQAERRIVRNGQKHKTCFIYDLVARGTADQRVLEFHKEGKDLFAALMMNPGLLRG